MGIIQLYSYCHTYNCVTIHPIADECGVCR